MVLQTAVDKKILVEVADGIKCYTQENKKDCLLGIAKEIIEDDVYRIRSGDLKLNDGDCILDIGANHGVFSSYLASKFKNLVIHAFEPADPVFELLRLNSQFSFESEISVYNEALGDRREQSNISYYPRLHGFSSLLHGHPQDSIDRLCEELGYKDLWRYNKLGFVIFLSLFPLYLPFRKQVNKVLLKSQGYMEHETRECAVNTVSDFIRHQNLAKIDLLKVDTQGFEAPILAGIHDQDWGKIRQIILEVHGQSTRNIDFEAYLQDKGFQCVAPEYKSPSNYILFAFK